MRPGPSGVVAVWLSAVGVLSMQHADASSLWSPAAKFRGPGETLQKALDEYGAGRFQPLLDLISRADRKLAEDAGPKSTADALDSKRYEERELGMPCGRDLTEFRAFELVVKPFLDRRRRSPAVPTPMDPGRTPRVIVRDTWIRGDVAEADIVLGGPDGPAGGLFRLIMLREAHEWHWALAGSVAVNMLVLGQSRPLPETRTASGTPLPRWTFGDDTDLLLRYIYGPEILRQLADRPTTQEFAPPDAWRIASGKPGATADDESGLLKRAAIGDRAAFEALRAGHRMPIPDALLAVLGGIHDRHPGASSLLARPPLEQWQRLEGIRATELAAVEFARTFPDQGEATAGAEAAIGKARQAGGDRERAIQAYELAVRAAPESPPGLEAQQRLASIYWNELKDYQKALPLIGVLQKHGALPRDIAVPEPLVLPRILATAGDIRDFAVMPDGSGIYLLEEGRYPLDQTSAAPVAMVTRVTAAGATELITTGGPILAYSEWIEPAGDGWLLGESGGFIRLSSGGRLDGARWDSATRFTERDVSSQGWRTSSGHTVNADGEWRGAIVEGDHLIALTSKGVLKALEPDSGAVLWRMSTDLPESRERARIMALGGAAYLVTSPAQGIVRIVRRGGGAPVEWHERVPLPWAPAASALACDAQGRVFAAREYEKTVAVYAPDGKWLRTFGVNEYGPKALAVDPDGLLLVSDGETVARYDAEGHLRNVWSRHQEFNARVECHISVTDGHRVLAIPGGGFVLASADCVAAYDAEGRRLHGTRGNFDYPTGPSGLMLGRHREVLLADHRNLYRLTGTTTGKMDAIPYSTERMSPDWGLIRAIDGDGAGLLQGIAETNSGSPRGGSAYEWFRYDLKTKRLDRRRLPETYGSVRAMCAAPSGGVWACFYASSIAKEPAAIRRLDAQGRQVGVLESAPPEPDGHVAMRPAWNPVSVERMPDGRYAVLDAANRRIVVFERSGRIASERSIGWFAQGAPQRLRVDAAGGMYVLSREKTGTILFKLDASSAAATPEPPGVRP